MSSDQPSIKPLKDGPLIVKKLNTLKNSRNENIEVKETIALCRCGASKNKPFCDGSHTSVLFSDSKDENRTPEKKECYKGKRIVIYDNRGICSHAGYCTSNLPLVFKIGSEPWIDADGAGVAEIIKTIKMCPSGALSYSIENKEENKFFESDEIYISKNGPYQVRGDIEIDEEILGDGASRDHFALCRCGKSGNKPRCDGTHWYVAFKDNEALTIAAANRQSEKKESEWHKVAEINELKENQIKKLLIFSQAIVLSRVKEKYGAVEGVCSHQGGPLTEGNIEDGKILCPWHGHAFDPLKGKAFGGDSDLKSFEVEERDDGIYLKIKPAIKSSWTVSHLLAETMVNWGVRHVFGMVGHSNLGMAEAIRLQEEKGNIKYIGVRHEGAAAFACSGYAKAIGKPAACFTIAGPGATNLITGLWDAKIDRAPVLAITGQVNTQFLGPGSFQEVDLKAAFENVASFSKVVLPGSNHSQLMSLALKHSIVQRNVSHLIVPDEVQTLDAGDAGPEDAEGRLSDSKITPSEDSINLAMYRIWKTKRPAIIIGYGARNSMDQIISFAEKLRAPILSTFKAKGQISEEHYLSTGVLGKSGTPVSANFMTKADLLIVFGASFSQHTGIDQTKPIIQVDIEQMALGKFHPVDNPIWGDVGITANLFKEKLGEYSHSEITKEEVANQRKSWRLKKTKMMKKSNNKGLNSVFIFDKLSKIIPDNALISLDVGNNTYSFGRYFECKNQKVILSGYLGSIGFGFPAAMGAFYALPNRAIVSISGDGGFGQYMTEFNTAVLHKMNITHILLNNGELGKISKEQRDINMPVWQTELNNPNFAEYAKSCGGFGVRVTENNQFESAIKEALNYNGPSIVEIISDPSLV